MHSKSLEHTEYSTGPARCNWYNVLKQKLSNGSVRQLMLQQPRRQASTDAKAVPAARRPRQVQSRRPPVSSTRGGDEPRGLLPLRSQPPRADAPSLRSRRARRQPYNPVARLLPASLGAPGRRARRPPAAAWAALRRVVRWQRCLLPQPEEA